MNAPLRRGVCPTLAAPMQTGDGLLARLNPVASGLSPKALIGLCEAALRHGNGVVEVTARGSFQIRGLTADSAAALATEVDALGIAVRAGVPVETGPLAGLDPDEIADPRALAERIREGIAAAGLDGRLGPKVSVVVDGGGHSWLDEVSADVRLTAVPARHGAVWRVAIGGDAVTARPVGGFAEADAADAALTVLAEIAVFGTQGRAKKLAGDGFRTALAKIGNVADVAPPSVLPDISPTRGEIRSHEGFRQSASPAQAPSALQDERCQSGSAISPLVGEMSGRTEGGNVERDGTKQSGRSILPLADGRFAVVVALPFGHSRADTLIDLITASAKLGAREIRLAPRRTLLFLSPTRSSADETRNAARRAGFIVDPNDPRARIAACPGSPACASGHIPARAMAAEIAASRPCGTSFDLHFSGCEKRCARPAHDGITLLGQPDGAALVLGGPDAAPIAKVAAEQGVGAIGRVTTLIAAERKPGETERTCLNRLGDRLAEAFAGEIARDR